MRGPLIRQAFELYSRGHYTFADLSEAMEDRGLTTKPSAKRSSKAVDPGTWSRLLRDRYCCGIITVDGAEHPGRHQALIFDDLFIRSNSSFKPRRLRRTAPGPRAQQLSNIESSLEAGARHLEAYLDFLATPEALDRTAGDQERRQLNQAIFVKVLVEDGEVTGTSLEEPIATLTAAQVGHQALRAGTARYEAFERALAHHTTHIETKKGTTRSGGSLLVAVDDLLNGIDPVDGSNKTYMLDLRGFEPLTSPHRTIHIDGLEWI